MANGEYSDIYTVYRDIGQAHDRWTSISTTVYFIDPHTKMEASTHFQPLCLDSILGWMTWPYTINPYQSNFLTIAPMLLYPKPPHTQVEVGERSCRAFSGAVKLGLRSCGILWDFLGCQAAWNLTWLPGCAETSSLFQSSTQGWTNKRKATKNPVWDVSTGSAHAIAGCNVRRWWCSRPRWRCCCRWNSGVLAMRVVPLFHPRPKG